MCTAISARWRRATAARRARRGRWRRAARRLSCSRAASRRRTAWVLEATGNALAIARILAPHIAEVVLAHPKRLRAISHAKIKTRPLRRPGAGRLLAAGLVPMVWVPDERTSALPRLIV